MFRGRKVSVGKLPALFKLPQLGRIFKRPSWADPAFLMRTSQSTFTVYTFTTVDTEMVLPANPKRWAVGFTLPTTIIANPRIAPHGDPTEFGENVLAGLDGTFWNIFDKGPLICFQWFGVSAIGQTMGVYEVSTQQV